MADARARPPRPSSSPPLSDARTYRLTLAYDGTGLHGWQIQPETPTLQGLLLAAAHDVFEGEVRAIGASRTDAGVHALGQVVALTATSRLAPAAVRAALNAHLPREIRVWAAEDAAPGFDARRRARGKRYVYLIDNGPVASPLLLRFAWHRPVPLDLAALRTALAAARGRHDFSAFCAAAGRDVEPHCQVRSVRVRARRSLVAIVISADRFLHHMVRNLVGSAVEVGRGARPPGWLAEVLQGRERTLAGPTAPAHGLTLLRVLY
ncbi:MAG TPA: tRNA pseudouridine(38-40) synthase TruA [Methylomirabilota bacterium]|nr:tRNA pseudouridine(38-40) synthase TruA [Methylomirabilota bacterium]